jgi:type IV secretory pathway VirB6-like protein
MGGAVGAAAGAAFAPGAVSTNFAIFAQIYNALFTPFQAAVASVSGALTTSMQGDVKTGVAVMMMIFLAGICLAAQETPVLNVLASRVLVPAAVTLFVLQNYNQYVITPASTFAPSIGNTIVGALGAPNLNGGAPFDTVWNHAYAAGVAVINAVPSGFSNIGPQIAMYFSVVLYWLVAAGATGLSFFLFIVSLIGLFLLLAIGPIFVGFGAFQFTRFLLKGYVSAVASLICAQVIVLALLGISIKVENTLITPLMTVAANANVWGMLASLLIVGVLLAGCTVLAFKASAYAVGICGGIFDGIAPWIASGALAMRSGAGAASGALAAASGIGSSTSSVTRPALAAGRSLGGRP